MEVKFNKIFHTILVLLVTAMAILFSSCSVNENIYLKKDGSGRFHSKVVMKKIFVDYLKNLSEVTGNKEKITDNRVFDIPEIKKSLEARKGLKLRSVSTPTPNTLEIAVDFTNIEEMLGSNKDIGSTGIISFKENGKKKELHFHLDKKNFKQLTKAFPALSNPLIESMGPQEGDTTTEADYLDMMKFALGEKGPEAIKTSYITVTLKCEGKIISQKGGKLIHNNTVVFKIPLIKMLLLNEALDYSVTFE